MNDSGDPFAALHARSHPLRGSLSREMHVRKMPRLQAPARVVQFVLLVDDADVDASLTIMRSLLAPHEVPFDPTVRFLNCQIGALGFTWERHSEFMTYSFLAAGGGPLFDLTPFAQAALWIGALPGRVIRSTQIAVIADAPDEATIATHFAQDDLIISDVADGQARIWSDFRLHADGFGRLLVQDKGLQGAELAQLVQRLQELGNYRKIALLGLPKRRPQPRYSPALNSD